MRFVFGALKIRERIQTIPSKTISTVGRLFRTSNFYFSGGPIVGGGPKIKEGATYMKAQSPKVKHALNEEILKPRRE